LQLRRSAVEHLAFSVELYREQMRHGGYFAHEHPAYATSWQEEVIKSLLEEQGVVRATSDQCLYGCESEAGDPVKKQTTFMTNSPEVAQ
jgi:hypothetical protein